MTGACLTVRREIWPIRGSFAISRGAKRQAEVVVAEIRDGGARGWAECVPYGRYGETVDGVIAAIEAERPAIEAGLDRGELVVAADKGPYYLDTFEPTFMTRTGDKLTLDHAPRRWRPYNSPNHRRFGQNCLFLGGNVSFERDPAVGIDADNIYTLMVDQWDGTGFNRIHGDSPHFSDPLFPFPGQDALGAGLGHHASTDSLIYP